jgi:predicted metal-binding protein
MEPTKSDFKCHVFVCTNQKKNGECCAPRGGEDLRRALKEWTREHPEWKGRIRINASGCLDRCTEGIAVAIYPQNEWFIKARPGDFEALKKEITALMAKSL